MSDKSSGRGLSISQRLMTLGVATTCAIVAMLAVGYYKSSQLDASLIRAIDIKGKVETINDLRRANDEITLAAMDTIIDRADRKIHPERQEIFDRGSKTLLSGAAIVKEVAKDLGVESAVSTYDSDVKSFIQETGLELKTLVESGADEDAYARIDDVIDQAGANLGKMLATLYSTGNKLVEQRVNEATTASRSSIVMQLSIGIVAFLVVLALQIINTRFILSGIRSARTSLQDIVSGNYNAQIENLHRSDEIGEIARAAEVFRQSAMEKLALEVQTEETRKINESQLHERANAAAKERDRLNVAVDALGKGLNQLAEGNLRAVIDQEFPQEIDRLRIDFNQVAARLYNVMQEISVNSSSIQANANQMRSAADDLAKRTEQQAASLEQTSAALAEITETVRTSTQRAEDAGTMVANTNSFAERSVAVVADAMAAMERIEDATAEIGKIINVVEEIAFQTNLLALNAGVEAARAGEAGKGFAVVAQEVRALAGRAATAAQTIKSLVGKSNDEVRTGVELVTATGEALHKIGEDVLKINGHVKSIVTSAREQSIGLSEINSAVGQMDHVTQQNAAMVEQTNAASHTLASDAENLGRLVGQFKVQGAKPGEPISKPMPVKSTSTPTPSPARQLIGKVAGAFSKSSNAPPAKAKAAATATATDQWEEF
ncbi:methyl-accepting chemotaxis protein [Allorhizobium terrae]|uniref:HAMP domain-containing protein n=1 Tax=Allorhizobium terrae TaxID=1848972 RepID=A0A4S4A5V9_9HYPH|nr:methyl-accepting chemotaxis protein [Allorhizobium terrae]THF53931.1 HAMP domain-containing protein [Allorhizobium terrae]